MSDQPPVAGGVGHGARAAGRGAGSTEESPRATLAGFVPEQMPTTPPQQRALPSPPVGAAGQLQNPQGTAAGSSGGLGMGHMTDALPNYRQQPDERSHNLPRHQPPSGHPSGMRSPQHFPSFATQAGLANPAYHVPYSPQYPPFPSVQHGMSPLPYLPQQHPQHAAHQHGMDMSNPHQQAYQHPQFYGGQQAPSPQYPAYPPFYRQLSPTQPEFSNILRPQDSAMDMMAGQFSPPAGSPTGRGAFGSGTIPSTPRGPPRKPKQSGHALWVGNLPPGTLVTALKDHFAREATNEIESVFLISKSNCAFVNYRTEDACAAAVARFHDSKFHGVRLVCRLRRSASIAAPGVPTGPAASTSTMPQAQTAVEAIAQNREVSAKAEEESARHANGAGKPNDRYFIVKSLTVEDLELSVRTGIWATQSHNEEAFNKAYEAVDNVYLIFSGNKSGEYFGYARMASPISDEAAAQLDWAPRAEAAAVGTEEGEAPRSIPTPATQFAPKGHIIDDSARGTIFWEADVAEHEAETPAQPGEAEETKSDKSDEDKDDRDVLDTPTGAQPFGKPFRVEWLSTNKLPFYRTRGLRNPWNSNREVKIARDGTELETSVGRRLLQFFHHGSLPPGPQPQGQMGYMGRMG